MRLANRLGSRCGRAPAGRMRRRSRAERPVGRPRHTGRVRAMGVAAWIECQIEPERIPDEFVERRLGAYPTLRMTTAELFQEFPRPDPLASTRRREQSRYATHTHSSAPAEEALQHATEALARFRDVAMEQAEGYLHEDDHERSK